MDDGMNAHDMNAHMEIADRPTPKLFRAVERAMIRHWPGAEPFTFGSLDLLQERLAVLAQQTTSSIAPTDELTLANMEARGEALGEIVARIRPRSAMRRRRKTELTPDVH
jgi:hypothetical protein